MADPEPSTTSGGHGNSTGARDAIGLPAGAVEMDNIDSTHPSVPAKDDPDSSAKGKAKEMPSLLNHEDRTDSLSIGAADSQPPTTPNPADGPVCNITLLLPTGARHPYMIDDRYLTKRNVDVPEITENGKKDPFSVSVYKLKELILREWRDEWDGKPASPSSIRLIHFGKLLDDKEQLNSEWSQCAAGHPNLACAVETNTCVPSEYRFSAEAPNVVHMSVKPAEMLEEDEAAKGKTGSSGARTTERGSGCCVIL